MNLGKFYRSTQLTTRIMLLASIIIFGAVFAWVNGSSVLAVAGGIFVTGLIIEAFFVYSRKSIILIIWLINLAVLSGFSYTLYWIYANFVDQTSAIILGGLTAITGIITGAVAHFLTAKLAQGRRWIHLSVAFVLYYAGVSGVLLLVPDVGPIYPIIAGLLLPVIYLCVVYFVKRKLYKKQELVEKSLPKNKNQTLLVKELKELLGSTPFTIMNETNVFVDDKAIVIISPLAGEKDKNVVFDNNKLLVDGEDYAWVLEHTALTGRTFSKENKIKQTKIIPVVVVNNINLPKTITPVKVRSRKNPDVTVGTVLIVKKNQLPAVLKQATTKLTDKEKLNLR